MSKIDFASYENELSQEDWKALSSFFPILVEGKTFMAALLPEVGESSIFWENRASMTFLPAMVLKMLLISLHSAPLLYVILLEMVKRNC